LYQLVHAVALVAVGLWVFQADVPGLKWAGWGFVGGVIMFSGSLYLLVLTGARWLGPITPLGGIALILGWVVLAWAALKIQS
jgi:uncharacterized membrane protein YgdD (TMEM256/DUF423 family)